MKNRIKDGDILPFVAAADVVGDEIVVLGDLIGISFGAVAEGESGEAALTGCYTLPKAAGANLAIAKYTKVYFDATAKKVTKIATDNKLIGVAIAAADNDAVRVDVRLNGISI